MKKLKFLTLLFALLIASCAKEALESPKENASVSQTPKLQQYKTPFVVPEASPRSSCYWTELAGGTTDQLSTAINDACDGGVIYLKAGIHTENSIVKISKPVKIIGEAGAILKIKSNLIPYDADFHQVVDAGIHIQNAPGTLIQDVDIQPVDSDGGTAILVENSPYSGIMRNVLTNFQYSVLIINSDQATMMFNKITGSNAWHTGEVEEVDGIINVSGKSAYIADNEIINCFLGVWATDSYGTYERNFMHGNYIGLILCNVPPYLILPGGNTEGSPNPAFRWKVRNNKSTDNFNIGYLVIDGANDNLLENNEAFNNTDYDIEMTSDSYRFGYLTPEAYNNRVNVGSFPNITIKNCGTNNTANGGILIDNALFPCN